MPFQPSAAEAKSLLAALTNPAFTFHQVAEQFGIDVEDLANWLLLPEIETRLARIELAIRRHTQTIAAAAQPAILQSQLKTLDTFNLQPTPVADPQDSPSSDSSEGSTDSAPKVAPLTTDLKPRLLFAKEAELVRKTCTLILKLAKPIPPPALAA